MAIGLIYSIFCYFLEYLFFLFTLQLVHQLGMSCIKFYYLHTRGSQKESAATREALGIPYHREAGSLLGLTGDNSPKKRIIAHDEIKSFLLPYLAFVYLFNVNFFSGTGFLGYICSLFFALIFTAAQMQAGFFFLAKIYSESGFGFNFYLQGWRQIGLDYHNWIIKQDRVTGKPLLPKDQYFGSAKLHIDIPPLDLHHWPWEQHETQKQVEEKKAEKAEQRERKLQRKLEKQAERQKKVQARKEQKEEATKGVQEAEEPEMGMDFFGDDDVSSGAATSEELTSPEPVPRNNSGLSDADVGLSPMPATREVGL